MCRAFPDAFGSIWFKVFARTFSMRTGFIALKCSKTALLKNACEQKTSTSTLVQHMTELLHAFWNIGSQLIE